MIDRRKLLKSAAAAAAVSAVPLDVAAAAGPRLRVRRGSERGHADHGWLDTYHTFSFGSYYDPAHMGFRALRVINDDRISGGAGFPMHPHKDMEIVTYMLGGALQHKDSQGNGSVIVPGEVQRMSAGTGIFHSEFNPSRRDPARLLQIWLTPDRQRLAPSYAQKTIALDQRKDRLRLLASPDGRDGSISWNTSSRLYASILSGGRQVVHANPQGRHVWVHVATGKVVLNGVELSGGDAVSTSDPGNLTIRAAGPEGGAGAEVLLFDLA
jgi:redox-sensitive bicupin YhaK (pirin superfamily)